MDRVGVGRVVEMENRISPPLESDRGLVRTVRWPAYKPEPEPPLGPLLTRP